MPMSRAPDRHGLEEPGHDVHLTGRHQPEHRDGARDIEEGDERRGDQDRPRQGAPGILDLAAQHRAQLQPREGERDRGPEVEPGAAAQVGHQRLERHRRRRRPGEERVGAETDQQRRPGDRSPARPGSAASGRCGGRRC